MSTKKRAAKAKRRHRRAWTILVRRESASLSDPEPSAYSIHTGWIVRAERRRALRRLNPHLVEGDRL